MQNNRSPKNTIIANIEHIKTLNFATIYRIIELNAPISRVKIAKMSQLAPASVTKITRQLLEKNLINETARQASTGGRCAISLAPNCAAFYVLCITIGHKNLLLSSYDLSGKPCHQRKIDINLLSGQQLLQQLLDAITLFLIERPKQKISALSITLSGLVDPQKGYIIYTPKNKLDALPLVEILEEKFHIPSFIGNHTRSLALAEYYFGASKNSEDSILISVHNGVGSGIIIQGKLLLGKHYNIGEIGHIQVNPAGNKCHCGNFGCLETEVSDPVILEKVRKALQQGSLSCIDLNDLNIERVYQAAADNDPLCQKIVADAATYLGKTISILINMLNPEKVIIAGKIICAQKTLFTLLKQCIAHQTLPDFQRIVQIEPAQLQANSTLPAFALIKQAIYEGDLLQKIGGS
ncbi:DNA-binding transcriptional dual regulator NagC [Psychromonas sp. CNPT3]|uniref:ROK family protein n=1 Tax=Psychromonas sp. CNPT3 TaxID=314282 RepID=UPI00006E9EB3|nr:ROK family protein [Psychromonas sp. CNPT3]AGH82168.1 DNA-binding transcriptional dual regulator NagC [Psychromonas sp. CNPT3]